MAVGRRGEFGQHFAPPVAIGGAPHGQFDCMTIKAEIGAQ